MSKQAKPVVRISRLHLAQLLDETNGGFFSVKFRKKPAKGFAVGELRTMVTRNHVKKDVKGTGSPLQQPTSIRRQYDMQKHAWRSINLSTTEEVHANGVIYKVVS